MLKNPVFLCGVKIPYQQFLTFSISRTFSEADVLQNRCSKKFCSILN